MYAPNASDPSRMASPARASLAIVDEADLVPDLDRLMRAVKPTTDSCQPPLPTDIGKYERTFLMIINCGHFY
jgi:hypothetical protein